MFWCSRTKVGLSSFLLFLFGITQVVLTWANKDVDTQHTWAFFANGCVCVLTGFCGILSTILEKKTIKKIYFLMCCYTILESIIVFIIYSSLLHKYIKNACGGDEFFNAYCQGIKIYLSTSTAVFWAFIVLLVPYSTIVSYGHLAGNDKTGTIEMDSRNN
ncbi:hypothetical protein CYY_007110 [Polysphondylium violaceum]|uniref:Transmembrane protein n=1 Tax=Polysphondylium violaceum TaxID=133409 RepID=A0A8J4PP45_9MYCE|nr:hypothetical protein CYY_007110 [Polysphondylium violaceum]